MWVIIGTISEFVLITCFTDVLKNKELLLKLDMFCYGTFTYVQKMKSHSAAMFHLYISLRRVDKQVDKALH